MLNKRFHTQKSHKATTQCIRAATMAGAMLVMSLAQCPVVAIGMPYPSATLSMTSEFSSYICNVGYRPEMGETYGSVLTSKADWDGFVASMADTVYHGDGTSESVLPKGLGDYSEDYFDTGILAVGYATLGSGGYSPSVTGISLDGDMLTIGWSANVQPDCLYTCDMSGFAVVVELPADSAVGCVLLEDTDSQGAEGNFVESPVDEPDNTVVTIDDYDPDPQEGVTYEAGVVLVVFPESTTEDECAAFLASFPFIDLGTAMMITDDVAEVQTLNGYPVASAVDDITACGAAYGIYAQPNFIYHLASDSDEGASQDASTSSAVMTKQVAEPQGESKGKAEEEDDTQDIVLVTGDDNPEAVSEDTIEVMGTSTESLTDAPIALYEEASPEAAVPADTDRHIPEESVNAESVTAEPDTVSSVITNTVPLRTTEADASQSQVATITAAQVPARQQLSSARTVSSSTPTTRSTVPSGMLLPVTSDTSIADKARHYGMTALGCLFAGVTMRRKWGWRR